MKGRVHVLSSTPCPLLRLVTLISQTADQSELNWERVRGSSPLWATDLYEKRMFVSIHVYHVCVCVIVPWVHDTAWFLWLVVWPRVSLWLENRRWHTQTHSWFPPMWYVYQQARSGIPFHQNKSQLSDRATFDNVTLLLPTCTFQPTLIRHSPPFTSPQNPVHPLLHLFLCSVSSRCFWAGQWHRPLLPFACILPQLWQKLSWLTDSLKKDKQLEHLASETSCLQDLPTQREIESHLKIELSFCNKELQGCTSYQHRLKSKMQDEKNQNIFSFLVLIHTMHILTCTVTFIVFPL